MDKLDNYRKEIDEIDEEIVNLFEKRMETVLKVAKYKKENKMEVLQSDREKIVLNKAISNLKDKKYTDDVIELFKLLMKLSKNSQKREIKEEI